MPKFQAPIISRVALFLSARLRWSTLARIGRAPIMRLTVIVPILGVTLIFNQETANFLTLSPEFIDDLGISESGNFSFSNLYFLYFGLCFLGFASALFSILCPADVSNQPNELMYISNIPSNETPVQAKANFQVILNSYFETYFDPFKGEETMRWENPEYPGDLVGDFHNLIQAMYSETDFGDDENGDENMPAVIGATGYPDFQAFAEMIWRSIAVEKVYWIPFKETAPIFAKDIAFLKFKSLDYSRMKWRLLIASLFLAGFLIALVPTVRTFFLLALNALSSFGALPPVRIGSRTLKLIYATI